MLFECEIEIEKAMPLMRALVSCDHLVWSIYEILKLSIPFSIRWAEGTLSYDHYPPLLKLSLSQHGCTRSLTMKLCRYLRILFLSTLILSQLSYTGKEGKGERSLEGMVSREVLQDNWNSPTGSIPYESKLVQGSREGRAKTTANTKYRAYQAYGTLLNRTVTSWTMPRKRKVETQSVLGLTCGKIYPKRIPSRDLPWKGNSRLKMISWPLLRSSSISVSLFTWRGRIESPNKSIDV